LLFDFPLIVDGRHYAHVRLQVPCGHSVYGFGAARGVRQRASSAV